MSKKTSNKQLVNIEEAAPDAQQEVPVNITEHIQIEDPDGPCYVVTRSGHRVSDKIYLYADDPAAISEKNFWTSVVKKWSHAEPVEVVLFDKKKHRIW